MHLICLVGHVSSDLVSPLFDRGFGVTHVTLLYDSALSEAIQHVAAVCRQAGVATTALPLRPRYDPATIRERLEAVIAGSRQPCLLNLAGATAVQAAIGMQVAEAQRLPAFAIEPEADTLVWLSRPEGAPLANGYNIADAMRLEDYFRLYGAAVVSSESRLDKRNPALEAWAGEMARLAVRQPRTILALNALASEVDAQRVTLGRLHQRQPQLEALLADSGLARVLPDRRIAFADVSAHRFLHGAWLERWIFAQASALMGELPIQDLASGIRIRVDGLVDNEYDVAILCNNQLYLIECKTVFGRGVDRDTLFKLDSVTHIAGLSAEAMLASLSLPTEHEIDRAGAHDIALLSGSALLQATTVLRRWLSGQPAEASRSSA